MDRRKFLEAIGIAGATSLAGCSSSGAAQNSESDDATYTTREGPPYFEKVRIDGPESVEVGEQFNVTVSTADTGGDAGNFTATLKLGQSVLATEEGIKIEDVPSGRRKEREIGPYRIGYAGDHTFQITDYAALYTLSVTPRQKAFGDTVTLWNDLTVQPRDLQIEHALVEDTDDGKRLYFPETGDFFVFIHLGLENEGTRAAAPHFQLRDGPSGTPGADQIQPTPCCSYA